MVLRTVELRTAELYSRDRPDPFGSGGKPGGFRSRAARSRPRPAHHPTASQARSKRSRFSAV